MANAKPPGNGMRDRWRSAVTLGDLLEAGIDVFCWCNRCHHNAIVATGALAARLNRPTPVPAVGERMRCTACGSRNVSTRPAWPSSGPITRHG